VCVCVCVCVFRGTLFASMRLQTGVASWVLLQLPMRVRVQPPLLVMQLGQEVEVSADRGRLEQLVRMLQMNT